MKSKIVFLLWCVVVVLVSSGSMVAAPEQVTYIKVQVTEGPPPPMKKATVSWYGDPSKKRDRFHGRRMANGEIFDATANMGRDIPTAAHRSLPFNSLVKFRNPKTGASVVAKIRDRGPFIRGREFDLSWIAARQLGILEQGVAMLEYSILKSG
jgi:rare lipoprotein A